MSKLSELYNGVRKERDAARPDIATKDELTRLEKDRANDPPVPQHNHPAPEWVVNPEDPRRHHMRDREARIHDLRNRLGDASRTLRRDFDRGR